jgi:hypothetical protein
MATSGYTAAKAADFETEGEGWIVFAAAMLGLAGAFNSIQGILAVADSRVFVGESTFVFSDLRTWGWIVLALGILQLLAAVALGNGKEWARWFGIACASVNAIGQLLFIPAYPFWALAMFAVDILIIYALAVYGGSRLREV